MPLLVKKKPKPAIYHKKIIDNKIRKEKFFSVFLENGGTFLGITIVKSDVICHLLIVPIPTFSVVLNFLNLRWHVLPWVWLLFFLFLFQNYRICNFQ